MAESSQSGAGGDPGMIRASAEFPRIALEIVRHPTPAGDGEQISIVIQATPSFGAFGNFVEQANPLALWMQWAETARRMWFPWMAAMPSVLPGATSPRLTSRRPGENESPPAADGRE